MAAIVWHYSNQHQATVEHIQLNRKAEQVIIYDRSILGVERSVQNINDCERASNRFNIYHFIIIHNVFPCFCGIHIYDQVHTTVLGKGHLLPQQL